MYISSALKRKKIIYIGVLIIIFSIVSLSNIQAEDEDHGRGIFGEDSAKDIGTIAIGLFAAGMINVIVTYAYRISRRMFSEEGITGKVRDFTRETYIKTRKPLNWLHYILTLAATTLVIIHGVDLINKKRDVGVFGWIATGIFLIYIDIG